MKIKYLGTAAAEGWPAVFCNCEYCKKAKIAGGKNIRTRSQALINDDLLIDFPGDTYAHALYNKLDLSGIKYCLITHSHIDHFMPIDLFFRNDNCYAHDLSHPTLELFGNKKIGERYKKFIGGEESERAPLGVTFTELEKNTEALIGEYSVTPLPAHHIGGEDAFVYLIKFNGKSLLYLHDTGIPKEEFFEYLRANPFHADLISYDCTYVVLPSGGGHMGLDSVPVLRKKLEDIGISDKNTVSVINHFSHNGKLIHDELVPVAEEMGFVTAFDGMEIEF